MSVAFWSVLLQPTSHRLPLPFWTGKGLAQTRVFRCRSLLLAHSPCSLVQRPSSPSSLLCLGAEQLRSGPGSSDKSGPRRRIRTRSGPGREIASECSDGAYGGLIRLPRRPQSRHNSWRSPSGHSSPQTMPLGPLGPLGLKCHRTYESSARRGTPFRRPQLRAPAVIGRAHCCTLTHC